MAMQVPRRRFTVDEYHKMGDAGILHEDDRVELIDGGIVVMSPMNVPPAVCIDRLNKLLNRRVPEEWTVRVQSPIYLNVNTEPEPDLVLLKPRDYLKLQHHPGPDDVLLAVEVADSTVRSDRRYKVPLYARADIPEVWVVNIPKKVVEVYSDPFEGKYQSIRRVGRGEVLNLTALPGVAVAIDDILR